MVSIVVLQDRHSEFILIRRKDARLMVSLSPQLHQNQMMDLLRAVAFSSHVGALGPR